MNDKYIDTIAAFGKLGIEISDRSRDGKEWAKSKVDCLSSILKLMQTHPEPNMTVMGLSLEQIRKIKQVAKQCSAERVTLIPYPNNQSILPFIRIYGGDKAAFFNGIGINPIQSDISEDINLVFNSLEKEYGIILYENTQE